MTLGLAPNDRRRGDAALGKSFAAGEVERQKKRATLEGIFPVLFGGKMSR